MLLKTAFIIQLLFLLLKYLGAVEWEWKYVFMPTWIFFGTIFISAVIAMFFVVIDY